MFRVKFSHFLLTALFCLAVFGLTAEEHRIIPVSYKACGPKERGAFHTTMLWDNKEGDDFKWCCYHGGYSKPQVHWVIMDLGQTYPITKIEVVHDGNESDALHMITEDYNIFGGATSMNGPWVPLQKVIDNTKKRNIFSFHSRQLRFIGIEVRDSQVGHGLNQEQDDWAVRINEIYIYSSEKQQAISKPKVFKTAGNSAIMEVSNRNAGIPPKTADMGTSSVRNGPATSLKNLYVFYNSRHPISGLQGILSRKVAAPYLSHYRISYISLETADPLIRQYKVKIAPTFLITDSSGKELRKKSFIAGDSDLESFLK